jgi:hypothetical protein
MFRPILWAPVVLMTLHASARADYVIVVMQQGANVIARGEGTINTTSLTRLSPTTSIPAGTDPATGFIALGSPTTDLYQEIHGPRVIGTGGYTAATSHSGDHTAIHGIVGIIAVPSGYVSNQYLQGEAIWAGAKLSTLGLSPGRYQWRWGAGKTADTLTLIVYRPN